MPKSHLIEQWRSGARKGHQIADVKRELERLGWTVEQGAKHWRAKHPALKGCPDFPSGLVTINAHAFGNQGEVHPDAIRDLVKAQRWVEEE